MNTRPMILFEALAIVSAMLLNACGATEESATAPQSDGLCDDGTSSCDGQQDDEPRSCGCTLGAADCDEGLQRQAILSVDAATGPLLAVSADRRLIATGGAVLQKPFGKRMAELASSRCVRCGLEESP